jgi:hypothetical protein
MVTTERWARDETRVPTAKPVDVILLFALSGARASYLALRDSLGGANKSPKLEVDRKSPAEA